MSDQFAVGLSNYALSALQQMEQSERMIQHRKWETMVNHAMQTAHGGGGGQAGYVVWADYGTAPSSDELKCLLLEGDPE